jgi:hypothetical protein
VSRRKRPPLRDHIFNQSPSGFSWCYGSSGRAQLALSLLLDVVGPDGAVALHQDCKWQQITPLPQDADWSMTASDALIWVENTRRSPA